MTIIEVVMVIIGILLVLSQAVKIPFVIWLGKRIFKPAFKAVVADPLKKWHAESVTAVVSEEIRPLKDRLEKEFGGNSNGLREAINTHRDEFLRKFEEQRNDTASQQGKVWGAITDLQEDVRGIHKEIKVVQTNIGTLKKEIASESQ